MLSDEGNNIISGNVPAFLIKLWRLVNDSKYDSFIGWSEKGNTFQVHDQVSFAHEILPLYFKHNNFTSFVRQLNMYGFRKIVGTEKGSLKSEGTVWEFHNPNFQKGRPDLLEFVKRKINPNDEKKLKAEAYEKMLADLQQVQGKQEIMDRSFENLKGQNERLWSEILDLRQKHKKQQIVINKLIHFIYNLINQSSIGTKRIMMPERDTHNPKRPRLNQQIIPASSSQPSILEMPDSPVPSPGQTLPAQTVPGQTLPDFETNTEDNILPQIDSTVEPAVEKPQLKLVMPSTTALSLTMPSLSTPDFTPSTALVSMDTVPITVAAPNQLDPPSMAVAPLTGTTTVEATSTDPLGKKLDMDRYYMEIPKSPRLVAGDYCDQVDSSLEGLQKILGSVEYNIDPSILTDLFDEADYVIYPNQVGKNQETSMELLDLVTSDKDSNEPSTHELVINNGKDVSRQGENQVVQSNELNPIKYGMNAIEWPFSDEGGQEVADLDMPLEIFES